MQRTQSGYAGYILRLTRQVFSVSLSPASVILAHLDAIGTLLIPMAPEDLQAVTPAISALLVKAWMLYMNGLHGRCNKASQAPFCSIRSACTRYPVSRSFLYERGEREGIVTRPTGRKAVVDTAALERW